MTSPDLTTSVTPPGPDHVTGLSGVMTSSLTVTPQATGNYTACVEIEDSSGYVSRGSIYRIVDLTDDKAFHSHKCR